MNIYSPAQVKEWDAFTIAHEPVTSLDLMERAAGAVFTELQQTPGAAGKHFIIFSGNGNNGGDGLALVRLLHEKGWSCRSFFLQSEQYSQDFTDNLQRLRNAGIYPKEIDGIEDFPVLPAGAVLIDALYGSGLNRPLEGLAALLVQHINSFNGTIISIDIPSGLYADKSSLGNPIVKATQTLSFQTAKLAFLIAGNAPYTGDWKILDIQLHPGYELEHEAPMQYLEMKLIRSLVKPRDRFSHKYNYGHALLFAGSPGMFGAGIMCARACFKTGVGLVSLAVEKNGLGIYQPSVPEAICIIDWDHPKILEKKTAIGIGPGWKSEGAYFDQIHKTLSQTSIPVVADATAIQWLAKEDGTHRPAPGTIITPHSGEFDKCFGKTANDFERMHLAQRMAIELRIYIVLKGAHTLIATPSGKTYFNSTGNAGMAKAGSGDVLTGILTGLLAQGYTQLDTCLLGVYLHGLAGDLASSVHTQFAMTASDIIEQTAGAWRELLFSI